VISWPHIKPRKVILMKKVTNDSAESNRIAGTNGTGTAGQSVFDEIAGLRISQDFGALAGVREVTLTVACTKPKKPWFFRTHPAPEFRCETLLLEEKESRETYIIIPSLFDQLSTEPLVSPRLILLGVTRQRQPFLWPLRLPGPDGRLDDWGLSELEIAKRAETRWTRMAADKHVGAYRCFEAACPDLSEPEWPAQSFAELLGIAFRSKTIADMDHPLLKKLRGEV
jgi:hypothetical protein